MPVRSLVSNRAPHAEGVFDRGLTGTCKTVLPHSLYDRIADSQQNRLPNGWFSRRFGRILQIIGHSLATPAPPASKRQDSLAIWNLWEYHHPPMPPTSPLFDTHAHLTEAELLNQLDQVIQRAGDAGVVGIVAIGTTLETSRDCVALAAKYENVWAAVGIQPNYCGDAQPGDWQGIEQLARSPRVVAIGETGLDRYWDHTPWPVQVDYFQRHIALSHATGRPLVIHMRDCEREMLDEVARMPNAKPVRGIMHSFTGTAGGATDYLELGLDISFAGMVTYPKSTALREVAALIPADRLLIETDSPYLSPHPRRSQRPNEPSLIVHTARCLAECRGVAVDELAAVTTQNARRLFGIG